MKYWLALDPMQMARIAAVLLVSACFAAAAARGWPPPARLAPFLVAVAFTQLAITVHNDYCDRTLDARAKPWRPVASGAITPNGALAWTVTLTVLAVMAALPLGLEVVALVATGVAAGFVYNARLKRSVWCCLPLWIALPTLVVCAFAAVGRVEPGLWPAYVIGAPLVVAIYLADTLDDIEVDTKLGVTGLAQRLGPRRARLVCWCMLAFGQALAVVFWPPGHTPGILLAVSIGFLVGAIILGLHRLAKPRWLAVMASAATLAIGWLLAVSA